MKNKELTIWKAIVLMLSPVFIFVVLYVCYRSIFQGLAIERNEFSRIIEDYIFTSLFAIVFIYGIRQYSFSFLWNREGRTLYNFFVVFLLGVLFFAISPFLSRLNLFFVNEFSIYSRQKTIFEEINDVIIILLLAPIVEELLFKNILNKLKKNYSILFSVFCVSFFFAIIHFQGLHWYSIAKYFFFSVVSCVVFLKTSSMEFCIFFHFLSNLFIQISKPYNTFLYEKVYTQYWYVLVLIFSVYGIIHLLSILRK